MATPESPGVSRVSTEVLRVCSKVLGWAQTNGTCRTSQRMTPFSPLPPNSSPLRRSNACSGVSLKECGQHVQF